MTIKLVYNENEKQIGGVVLEVFKKDIYFTIPNKWITSLYALQ